MSIKKIVITTVLALAVVVVAAPAVQADQLSDLMAQIQQLTAQLNALQGTSASTTTGTGACAGVTLTSDLKVGSTGAQVSCVQSLVGNAVTGTFGVNTKAHVITFQGAHAIATTGTVGPRTRAALTTLMGTASNPVVNPVTPGTGTTGFISIPELAASPASNANVTSTSNIPVLGVDVRAIGSDMTVSSAKVQLAVTKSSAAEHPATSVQKLYVYDGSTLLGTYPVTTDSVIKDGSNYYVILSGFAFKVPVNTTKALTVNADFAPSLETSRVVTVNLYGSDALRATDTMGAYTTATNASTRQYTVAYATVSTSTLTVAADTATTISASVNVNATSGTTNVPMLVFDAKSTTGASKITDLKFTAQGTASAVAKLTAVKLYDGSTLLGSQSLSSAVSGATASFTNLTIAVPQDTTKVLTVKADFASGVSDGTSVSLSVLTSASDVTYQQPNLTSTTATGTATGNAMYLYNGKAATLSFTNATSTYSYNTTTPSLSYTTGVITFKIHADGGTLTALTNATSGTNGIKVNWYLGSTPTALAASNVSVDFQPVGGTNGNNVSDGGDAIVTVTTTVPRSTSSTGFVKFAISEIDWTVGTTAGSQTWGLGDFKTPMANEQ